VTYLDGLVISSREECPTVVAFRQNQAVFNTDLSDASLAPWREKAQAQGLRASAALPIERDGQVWGVLMVFREDEAAFEAPLRALLRELAQNIGWGLERVQTLQQLVLLRAALESAADGVLVSDARALTLYINPAFTRITGYTPQEMLGRNCDLLQSPDTDAQAVAAIARAVQQSTSFSGEILNVRKDGTPFWNWLRIDPVRDAQGRLIAFIGAQRDITAQVQQRDHLARLQRLYQALAAEGDIVLQGRSSQAMFERTCQRLVSQALFHAVWIAQPNDQGQLRAVAHAGREAELVQRLAVPPDHPTALVALAWRTQAVQIHQDNVATQAGADWADDLARAGWASAMAAPVRRSGVLHAVLVFVSERVGAFDAETVQACERVATLLGHGLDELDLKERLLQLQQQEAAAARTDALTQIPNRFALEQHLPHALARARRSDSVLAVGMIDLDDFKSVNDQYAHDAGDLLLRELAQRLQAKLRNTDYLARLGGDEFVVLLEDLDPAAFEAQLTLITERLAQVAEEPFDLGQGRRAQVGMTLGLALYPGDGEDGDTLLRNADAAMYQAKARKGDRPQWWRLWREGTLAAPQVEAPFDPYGPDAQALLTTLAPVLQTIASEFAAAFYEQLRQDPQTAPILDTLSPQELAHLQAAQAQHLQFLLHPDTTAQALQTRAQHLGQVHVLVGLPVAALMRAVELYASLLRAQIERTPIMAVTRYRLLRVFQARLQEDLQGEIVAKQVLLATYHALLAEPLPAPARLADWMQAELDRLTALPGVRAAAVFRVFEGGQLRIEIASGAQAAQVQAQTGAQGVYPSVLPGPDGQRGPLGQAWVSGTRQAVDAYLQDPRTAPWHPYARQLGWRSSVAIPLTRAGTVEALLYLLGGYPRQFSNPLLQVWLDAVQHRWEQGLACSTGALPPRDAGERAQWRSLLYAGALRLVVQPVVDLQGGQVSKVEALARLQSSEGRLIAPGQFLPALGQSDLTVLFRQVLAQSLTALRAWRQDGLELTLSLNLDPMTLVDPDCPLWVERALREADLPPAALTLELLETQEIDPLAVDEATPRLRALGVQLAMDDLGSGYSSMKRLASLPFDVIKIDQDMVKDVQTHPLQGVALMRTVLQMGRDMDSTVVAEGLEDAALIEVAQLLGCPLGQGYGLAPPMPIDAFPEWLRTHTPLPLPDPADLHTWLGAMAYTWLSRHDGRVARSSLAACPLTRFFARQGVQDAQVLRWHALWHESAFEQERLDASRMLLMWMEEKALEGGRGTRSSD
jgi:diguanylate cyclase (GGDEF)-like protein/PAS domain S-box-containing protein